VLLTFFFFCFWFSVSFDVEEFRSYQKEEQEKREKDSTTNRRFVVMEVRFLPLSLSLSLLSSSFWMNDEKAWGHLILFVDDNSC
jgi:hypothetical protein